MVVVVAQDAVPRPCPARPAPLPPGEGGESRLDALRSYYQGDGINTYKDAKRYRVAVVAPDSHVQLMHLVIAYLVEHRRHLAGGRGWGGGDRRGRGEGVDTLYEHLSSASF